jgi:hypothetical protein
MNINWYLIKRKFMWPINMERYVNSLVIMQITLRIIP